MVSRSDEVQDQLAILREMDMTGKARVDLSNSR